jgi:hypothetical protein
MRAPPLAPNLSLPSPWPLVTDEPALPQESAGSPGCRQTEHGRMTARMPGEIAIVVVHRKCRRQFRLRTFVPGPLDWVQSND